jgi:hypothetical protein
VITVRCNCGHKQKVGDYPSRWKCSKCGEWQNYDPVIDNPARLLIVLQEACRIRLEWSYEDYNDWLREHIGFKEIEESGVGVDIDLMTLAYAIAEFVLSGKEGKQEGEVQK